MKSTITITVDTEVIDRLRRLDVNKSALINDYLKYYVERHTGKIPQEEPKIDPMLEKKIGMLRKELETTNFTVPPYYTIDKPDLLDIFLWDKAKELASRFEIKTDQALTILEKYLNEQKEKSEKERLEKENNAQKETLLRRIFSRD
ncbi:MAG: type II toxin-antitoxin system CcdA family antitoxin [Candidatus Micrarchaeaceae archaeon]